MALTRPKIRRGARGYRPAHAVVGSATQLFADAHNFFLLDIYDTEIHVQRFDYDPKALEFTLFPADWRIPLS